MIGLHVPESLIESDSQSPRHLSRARSVPHRLRRSRAALDPVRGDSFHAVCADRGGLGYRIRQGWPECFVPHLDPAMARYLRAGDRDSVAWQETYGPSRMTQHDIRASLYAQVRVMLYADDRGRAVFE